MGWLGTVARGFGEEADGFERWLRGGGSLG